MKSIVSESLRIIALLGWFFPCLLPMVVAQTPFWSDDLEQGSGNWTIYSFPGAPACTSLQYVSTATDPNCNHTPGGSYGLAMTAASDRLIHDVDLSAYPGASLRLSLWFYDVLDTRPGSWEPFDLRDAANTQILGLGGRTYGYPTDRYYLCRVLTAADGSAGPGWTATPILRTAGWHQFEIVQYRGASAHTAEFYIDGIMASRNTNVLDLTLDRLVLGLGWSYNIYQAGYVDDIALYVVPEPAVPALAGLGAALLMICRRRKHGIQR